MRNIIFKIEYKISKHYVILNHIIYKRFVIYLNDFQFLKNFQITYAENINTNDETLVEGSKVSACEMTTSTCNDLN